MKVVDAILVDRDTALRCLNGELDAQGEAFMQDGLYLDSEYCDSELIPTHVRVWNAAFRIWFKWASTAHSIDDLPQDGIQKSPKKA